MHGLLDGWTDRWMEGQMIQRDKRSTEKNDRVNQPNVKM